MYDTPTYVWQELYYTHTYIFGGSFIFHLNLVFATSDEFWEYLKNELSTEEAKNAKITDEIEGLSREYVEDYSKLVNGIEGLSCSLELIESQVHDCNTSYCKLKNVKARIHEEWNFEVLISLFLCFFY
uniref:Uncharacterized protein LOC104246888 isoform X3 n=1 Tax=Nicotiana sylvestris TaxID=4096 RepID=A0A1U7YPD2_NICSY|nr:PREDICTED: uncharacterized protein LOC104246888 isoform X3 [Nicotiana sylvestris]